MIEYERHDLTGVPDYRAVEFEARHSEYCLLIPVINEGARILTELGRAQRAGIDKQCDIVLCDGGSTDGSMKPDTLALYGVDPVVLREEDVSLHDPEASTLREKKRSDLKNRVRAVEAVEGGTLLSIHQNSYPGSQYRGAQVFYAPTGGSRELAELLQTALREELQPDNDRQAKPIPESVYLMNHVSCPAVLVECGFLTNPEEEALLRDGGYQRQLAAVLAGAWLTAQG